MTYVSASLLKMLSEKDRLSLVRKSTRKGPSSLEQKFFTLWRDLKGPQLIAEHRFSATRKWRFDFAHVASMSAIEVEGAIWANGRHSRGGGFIADCEKYNTAGLLGWKVFRLTNEMITAPNLRELITHCELHSL